MKLTASELETLVLNVEGMNEYVRGCIGSALCRALYDSANEPEDYPGEYSVLYDATFYNCPSVDDMALCFSYMREVWQEELEDVDLTLYLD